MAAGAGRTVLPVRRRAGQTGGGRKLVVEAVSGPRTDSKGYGKTSAPVVRAQEPRARAKRLLAGVGFGGHKHFALPGRVTLCAVEGSNQGEGSVLEGDAAWVRLRAAFPKADTLARKPEPQLSDVPLPWASPSHLHSI